MPLLPLHSTIRSHPLSATERVVANFTDYQEIALAMLSSDVAIVLARLRGEWGAVGKIVCFPGVNATVFSMSRDSDFHLNHNAYNSIMISSIATGFGVIFNGWYILRYQWANLHTCQYRARDLYGSYLAFSICARLPLFFAIITSSALVAAIASIMLDIWPTLVFVPCTIFAVIFVGQYVAFYGYSIFTITSDFYSVLQ
ncbi:hypothetical protein BDZ94DRAFT_1170612 [Collybia nuda]|uniref:Uncharacterized protein n=1 Tax=Collybia nuda TaxID=64659 RepID=A0A9P5Y0G7_9AGAR|nr:hypothetical protein BDZ94DRAFT_1170612 [Collybia nuda]